MENKLVKEEMVKKYICIHGHFYQPYRKNPWIEKIEMQESSFPYHDWNKKITAQCYSANGFAHVLNSQNKLEEIINNYSKISFNFGPTLLEWLKENEVKTFKRILQADTESLRFFSDHGSAIAQTYNHLIMPLAEKNDKYLQVYWAIKDFEDKFNREPEGMWIAETAVDYETLEALAEFNIKFTILSPDQAKRFRKPTKKNGKIQGSWVEVLNGNINTRMPYLCKLPSGKKIVIFFYDKEISVGLSFGDLLNNGEKFANCLINAPSFNKERPEIVIVASDGETYGHHKKFGDMALAYCLKCIEKNETVELTVFGEYLQKYPPDYEVEIMENTAWSCFHSLCRWKEDCGCASGEDNHPNWNQKWRAPLREAISLLRVKINETFEKEISYYVKSSLDYNIENNGGSYLETNLKSNLKPITESSSKSDIKINLRSDSLSDLKFESVNSLALLKEYINIINDRSDKNINGFLNKYLKTGDSPDDFEIRKSKFLSLLEMQRQAMLMQSSDGWFFDDICRIESIQILRHARRAVELAREFSNEDLQDVVLKILVNAKSNMDEKMNGAIIYNKSVIGAIYTPERVAAHLISNLLFNKENKNNNFNSNTDININQPANKTADEILEKTENQTAKQTSAATAVVSSEKTKENFYEKIVKIKNLNNNSLSFDFYSYKIEILNLKYLQNNYFKILAGTAISISKITLKKFLYNFTAIYNRNYLAVNSKEKKILSIYIKELDNKIKDESPNDSFNHLGNFPDEIEKLFQSKNVKKDENEEGDKGYAEAKNGDFLYGYLEKLSDYKLFTLNDLNTETQIEIFKILIDDMHNKNAYNITQGSNAIKNLPDFVIPWINDDFLKIDINNLNLFANKILIYNLLNKKDLNHDDIEKLNGLLKSFQNQNFVCGNNYLIEFLDFSKLNLKTNEILINLFNLFLNNLKNEYLLKDAINLISIFNALKINKDTWEIQNILYEIKNKIIKLKNDCKILQSENLIKYFSYLLDYFGINNKLD